MSFQTLVEGSRACRLLFYSDAGMPEMTPRTLLPCTYYRKAPFKKVCKVLMWGVFIFMPVSFDKFLYFREELFDWIKVR